MVSRDRGFLLTMCASDQNLGGSAAMPKYFIQGADRATRGREFIAVVIALVALSMLYNAARASCCDAGGQRGGGWVWRPVGWSWGAGVWWRAEGPGAPVWGD